MTLKKMLNTINAAVEKNPDLLEKEIQSIDTMQIMHDGIVTVERIEMVLICPEHPEHIVIMFIHWQQKT